MNVLYSESARQSEEFARLQQATGYLEEALGKSAGQAKAEWDYQKANAGEDVYSLSLSHGGESAATTLTPEELQSRFGLRFRMFDLWGDLLELRQEREFQELRETAS
jgi:hypothetical protein